MRPNAVSFIGVGVFAVSVTSGGNVLAAYPAGYTPVTGDLGYVFAQGLHNTGSSLEPAAPSGWVSDNTRFQNIGTYDLQITGFGRVLQAGDGAVNFVVPAAYSTASGGLSVYMLVFRGVDTVALIDTASIVSSGAAAATFTPTGITTVSPGAMVISAVASGDDNALGLNAGGEQGFTLRAGNLIDASNYDTTTGGDHAMGAATKQIGAPGAVTCPTWQETLVGNDAWVAITVALRPKYVFEPAVNNRAALIRAGHW